MKLKLSRKSLDQIHACEDGKESLLKNRSWFQNLFDIGIGVERHHLVHIKTEDIRWFMRRLILRSHHVDFMKIAKVIYNHSKNGLCSRYKPEIEAAVIERVEVATRTEDRWKLASAVILMETMDICTVAAALLDIDYSYNYSDRENFQYRCGTLSKYFN